LALTFPDTYLLGRAVIGVLAGLIAAFVGAHLASALLFETSSHDGVSICVSVSALLIIALLAAVLPASRAASINPVEALRSEWKTALLEHDCRNLVKDPIAM